MAAFLFYLGRAAQLLGMVILLEDVLIYAGPLGPNPRVFAAGVAVFIAGWALTRAIGKA
jgi:hypothetical protein